MELHASRPPQPTLQELAAFLDEQGLTMADYNSLPTWERTELVQKWQQQTQHLSHIESPG
ncbi:MAG: hypothetical protein HY785_26355 [Oscillatoriophycideae cyanobacterium NC_groundwater_1537_Pr4_S-0.65um_50_18]|nr:hypothetical protein [Oscillatoriophycideae cyanobacterium NC_groundwater_1537_Pr4_S-0.65um_50_18]